MKSKLTILSLALVCPAVMFSQVTQTTTSSAETTTMDTTPSYNSWSISFGGGIPLMQNADLRSIQNEYIGRLFCLLQY
jgi:OOP family OmpA-OmpF porin